MSVLVNPYSLAASGGGGGGIFQDDFNDNSIDSSKWIVAPAFGYSQAGTSVAETGQQLVITPASGSSGNHYNSLQSVPTLDFTGKTLTVDVVSYLAGGGSDIYIQITDKANDNNNISVEFYNGPHTAILLVPSAQGNAPTFDAGITKWRIRHINPGNLWEISSYKTGTWTVQFTSVTPDSWNPTNVTLMFAAGTFASDASPGTFIFDNVVTDATY